MVFFHNAVEGLIDIQNIYMIRVGDDCTLTKHELLAARFYYSKFEIAIGVLSLMHKHSCDFRFYRWDVRGVTDFVRIPSSRLAL